MLVTPGAAAIVRASTPRERRAQAAARAVETQLELARQAGLPEELIQEITAQFDPDGSAKENRQIAEALRQARLAAVEAAAGPTPPEPHAEPPAPEPTGEGRSQGGR